MAAQLSASVTEELTMTKVASKPAIKILNKKFVFGAEGTKRNASWLALASQKGKKTAEAYKANGGATKYLARWAKMGVIEIAA